MKSGVSVNVGVSYTSVVGSEFMYLKLQLLYGILKSYVPTNRVESLSPSDPVALSPHKFIQVGWALITSTSSHPLQFCFNSCPVTLNMIGVNPCSWVLKMQ